MYNAYYQFRESPFSLTPDPEFYYSNGIYREAWAALRNGIEGRKGFVLITGEAGTGKTTLLRKALRDLPPNIKTAYIPNSLFSVNELPALILRELGMRISTSEKFHLTEQLNRYLLDQFNNGNIVALLFDEAQDLSAQCLEELRLLGDLEVDSHKLLQIVLVGQPGLEEKLHQPELLHLKQQVALRCRLRPIDTGEVGAYIESRLQTVARISKDIFETEALENIALYSKGVPRVINTICDKALLTACAAAKFKVTSSMIDEVAKDLLIDESWVETAVFPTAPPSEGEANAPLGPLPPIELRQEYTGFPSGPSYSKPVTGWLAAMALFALLGGWLISQKQPPIHSETQDKITVVVANGRDDTKRGETATADFGPKSLANNSPLPPPDNLVAIMSISNPNIATARSPSTPDLGKTPGKLTVQPASVSKSIPEHKSPNPAPLDEQSKANSSIGNFFVVGASFVRSKPTSNAEIIATLEPGTPINVAGRIGEYYRVRSLGPEIIRGYVHEQDAFFERH